jgi:hypothetical protein
MPFKEATNKTVIKIKAAHPFMLITVQRGNVKFDTFGDTFKFFSAHSIAKGIVLFEDLEKNARVNAGNIPLATFQGEIPLDLSKRGRKINPCTKFAPVTHTR